MSERPTSRFAGAKRWFVRHVYADHNDSKAVREELARLVEFAVVGRQGRAEAPAAAVTDAAPQVEIPDVSSTEIRDRVAMVQAQFPKDVKPPAMSRFQGDNAQPVVVLALLYPVCLRYRTFKMAKPAESLWRLF